MKQLIAATGVQHPSLLTPENPIPDVPSIQVRAVRALMAPGVSRVEFVKLAEAFRRAVSAENAARRPCTQPPNAATSDLIDKAESILRRIEDALAEHRMPLEADVAQACAMTTENLAAILLITTSLDYRKCRRALRLRRALPEVVLGREQIAQIAYRAGYEYPSQFDRDFDETLGMSPTTMRKLCR